VRPCFGSAVILHFGFRDRFAFFSWILATGSVRIFFGFARPGTRFPFSAVASQSWCFFPVRLCCQILLLLRFLVRAWFKCVWVLNWPLLPDFFFSARVCRSGCFLSSILCCHRRLAAPVFPLILSHAHRYLPPILRSLSRSVSAILGLR
jgi:hypothetical protein